MNSLVPKKNAWLVTASSIYGNTANHGTQKAHNGILDNGPDVFHSLVGPFQWIQVDFGRPVQVRSKVLHGFLYSKSIFDNFDYIYVLKLMRDAS